MMDSIGDRIRSIRKDLNLSQGVFGAKVKVTNAHISNIENGNDYPSDMLIKLITIEFSVNEEWLRNGTGEKYKRPPKKARDALNSDIEKHFPENAQQIQHYTENYLKIIHALGPGGATENHVSFLNDPELVDIINYLMYRFSKAKDTREKLKIEVKFEGAFDDFSEVVKQLNDEYLKKEEIKELRVAEDPVMYEVKDPK